MRIVDRKTFLALPPETVFSKYEPFAFEDLCIKGETWTEDFLVQPLGDSVGAQSSEDLFNKLTVAERNGTSLNMDFDCLSRDGCYDPDQLFAVWEPDDVRQLIARLQQTLLTTEGD